MKKINILFGILLLLQIPFISCSDADLEDVVKHDEHYRNVDDADAAVLGLYGKFMELAAPVVVLNELRGDLMDVTSRASSDLQDVNLHKPSKSNTWTDVSKFYEVIQNCNDILVNFDKMLKENRLEQDEYKERYSDVAALRCWVYLQLAVQFDKVPYITDPITDLSDIYKAQKKLSLDEILPELITCVENLPTLEDYQNASFVNKNQTLDGYQLKPFFINKKCLLGDLYLYSDRYEDAARLYRQVLATGENLSPDQWDNFRKYRLYTFVWTSGEPNWFQVLYVRYKDDDANSFKNAWVNMFKLPYSDRSVPDEMIWHISYDYRYAPTYPFIELFDKKGKGKYYLKPSEYAVSEVWGGEVQKNNFPFDARGNTSAFEKDGNDYVVKKYSLQYDVTKPYEQQGKWFLYRAGLLHLRYAEAANRAGYPMLAWALVNDGIKGTAFRWKDDSGNEYPNDVICQSGWGPGNYYPEPYYFDGRQSEQPYIRAPWRNNGGLRGRANLPNVVIPNMATKQDSINFIEKMIIHEAALEAGLEGHRWGDLIRIARRLEKEQGGSGSEFLQNQLSGKYRKSGYPMPDLSSKEKWYLPMVE